MFGPHPAVREGECVFSDEVVEFAPPLEVVDFVVVVEVDGVVVELFEYFWEFTFEAVEVDLRLGLLEELPVGLFQEGTPAENVEQNVANGLQVVLVTGSCITHCLRRPRCAPLEQKRVLRGGDSSPFLRRGKTLSRKRSHFSGFESNTMCSMSS